MTGEKSRFIRGINLCFLKVAQSIESQKRSRPAIHNKYYFYIVYIAFTCRYTYNDPVHLTSVRFCVFWMSWCLYRGVISLTWSVKTGSVITNFEIKWTEEVRLNNPRIIGYTQRGAGPFSETLLSQLVHGVKCAKALEFEPQNAFYQQASSLTTTVDGRNHAPAMHRIL